MTIYDQHDKAFTHIEAAVIVNPATCERVGTIAFKRAASGLRVTCFLHVLGIEMTAARADGGGYDKHTASAIAAAMRMRGDDLPALSPIRTTMGEIKAALRKDDGTDWRVCIERAGFKVFGAV